MKFEIDNLLLSRGVAKVLWSARFNIYVDQNNCRFLHVYVCYPYPSESTS